MANSAKKPSDDTAHQQKRNENCNQRDADRNDCEADFSSTIQSGIERRFALFAMPVNIFQHHNGVVHDKADRNTEPH